MTKPVVGIMCSHHLAEQTYEIQAAGRRNVEAVARVSECTPLLIPGMPDAIDVPDLLDSLDGIILTGGRANVHPNFYGEDLTEAHGAMDEERDTVSLALVRGALEKAVPVFGLCRGIQEMNVALGGTLHPEIGDVPGRHRHRMPKGCTDPEIIFELREQVRLKPDGELARMLGTEQIVTNSLHGQAIWEPGDRVVLEGWAADETIEAISVEGAETFTIGVQWHPEYEAHANPVSSVLFSRFGDAARDRKAARTGASV